MSGLRRLMEGRVATFWRTIVGSIGAAWEKLADRNKLGVEVQNKKGG